MMADETISTYVEQGGDSGAGGKEKRRVKVVMLDIEGTVCPISFVKDELFPYFLHSLPTTLSTSWTSSSLQPYILAFPEEYRTSPSTLQNHCHDLTTRDIKDPALKALQGYIWQTGYASGAIKCTLFPDVAPAFIQWRSASIPIVIYSSGSIAAQKSLFGHTTEERNGGDLNPEIEAYFDTVTAGMKTERASYERIFESFAREDVQREDWLFLSDNVREVEAAGDAGMDAVVVVREGNKALTKEEVGDFSVVRSFEELEM